METKWIGILSQNEMKLIAAFSMLLDHVGFTFFPNMSVFRILGRLAFPLFAYFIYEGCMHTHNRRKYLTRIFLMGVLCMAGYYFYSGIFYGNVFVTFSLSICVIYGLQFCQSCWKKGKYKDKALGIMTVLSCFLGSYAICSLWTIDYGFHGVLLPVAAAVFAMIGTTSSGAADRYWKSLLGFAVGTLALSIEMGGIQYYSLLCLPLLLAYNGNRGKMQLQPFFYWFYPVHLMTIGLVSFVF